MRNHYRPAIQNGQIAKRPRRGNSPQFGSSRSSTNNTTVINPRVSKSGALRANATAIVSEIKMPRVLLALVGAGALIAAGFLFGLHEQFVAYAFNREEVKVQSKIEQVVSETRALKAEQKHDTSPQSLSQLIAGQKRLQPLKLDPAKQGAKKSSSH
ncbi:MAG TPA: hypothetical protein VEF04_12940 [Blastocatellia bacterium]|nr:hypothetical protein [Blastocatellia bacterium]